MNEKNQKIQDFENNLKSKMDELASSVDCFDKIAKRAFPEQTKSSEDFEYTVSDLENVSGRRNKFRITSFVAAAAAIVLCLFFLAKPDGFLNNVLFNAGKSEDKQAYRQIIAEIKELDSDSTYVYKDLTLDQFIKYDTLILPFYGCPFERSETSGLNVRIFIRTCGDVYTNQIYAVVYEGSFEDENFIAAADTNAKFEDSELNSEQTVTRISSENMLYTAENLFDADESNNAITDSDENEIELGAFNYRMLCKTDNDIIPITSAFYYWHNADDENNNYSYDIYAYDSRKSVQERYDTEQFESDWNNVVYFNCKSAAADTELSDMTKADTVDNIYIAGDNSMYADYTFMNFDEYSNTENVFGASYDLVTSSGYTAEFIAPFISAFSEYMFFVPADEYYRKSAKIEIKNTFDNSVIESKDVVLFAADELEGVESDSAEAQLLEQHLQLEEELRKYEELYNTAAKNSEIEEKRYNEYLNSLQNELEEISSKIQSNQYESQEVISTKPTEPNEE